MAKVPQRFKQTYIDLLKEYDLYNKETNKPSASLGKEMLRAFRMLMKTSASNTMFNPQEGSECHYAPAAFYFLAIFAAQQICMKADKEVCDAYKLVKRRLSMCHEGSNYERRLTLYAMAMISFLQDYPEVFEINNYSNYIRYQSEGIALIREMR